MTHTISQETVDRQVAKLIKSMKREHGELEGLDRYTCGTLDGAMEMLEALGLLTEAQYAELYQIGPDLEQARSERGRGR